jgi:hypothetical protein
MRRFPRTTFDKSTLRKENGLPYRQCVFIVNLAATPTFCKKSYVRG